VCFLSLLSHTGLRAQSAPGFPCALSQRGLMRLQTSGESRRENAVAHPQLFEIRIRTFLIVVPAQAGIHTP